MNEWQEYKTHIEHILPTYIPNDILKEPVSYALVAGGKRFRASLCYLVTELFGASIESADSSAIALECIHAYSLVHDDLPAMDDDDLRRGQPTCHKKFDEATAVLTGDILQTMAFWIINKDSLLSDTLKVSLSTILSETSMAMVLGQKIDIDNAVSNQQELEELHSLKTGALLKASILMGARVSNASEEDFNILGRIGTLVGLAYQVQDDVIELSDNLITGKSSSDEKNNKTTFVSILGKKEASEYYQSLYTQALKLTTELSVEGNKLYNIIEIMQNRNF